MLPWTAQLLFFRNFDKSIYVRSFKAQEIKVINNDSRLVNLDGESVLMDKELVFSINHKSLNVIIPEDNDKERKEPSWYSLFNEPLFPIRSI